ncbi:MAG: TPM domain-containing protein [Candidatus Saccharimonas sp.]
MQRIWRYASIVVFFGALLLLVPSTVQAANQPAIPKAPTLETPIVDQTGTLSQEQISAIAKRVQETRGEKAYQIGILMIKSLDGYPIEDYSIKVAREWGIGEKDKNNGLLLLVAKDDRRMRIEVGSGLEGDLTDLQSSHIINDVIAPEFKKGDYYQGVYKGVESIAALVQGQPDPHGSEPGGGILEAVLSFSWVAFFGLLWLGSVLGRSKSWWAGGVVGGVVGLIVALIFGFVLWSIGILVALVLGGLLLDFLVSRNFDKHKAAGDLPAWWAGGGWGGGLGGGGGFGGGGFSGGGSSGSW